MMKLFLFLILTVASAQNSPMETWKSCSRHAQCIRVSGICLTEEVINKKYQREYELYLEEKMKVVKCAPPTESTPPKKKIFQKATKESQEQSPRCLLKKCTLQSIKKL